MNFVARLRSQMSAYPPLLWLLGVGSFINVAGSSFLWPLNSIYIHEQLGKPLTVAGVVLLLSSGGATLGQLVGGTLYDRFGARPVMLTGLFAAAGLVALPGLFSSWPLYVAVMLLYGFAGNLVFPAVQALLTKAWPSGGRKAFNFIYVANNLGVAVGTAIGGIVAQHSFRLAFVSAAFMFFIYALYVLFFIHDPKEEPVAADSGAAAALAANREYERPIPWVPIGALFFGFALMWLAYVQWQGAVAVQLQSMGIPLSAYSLLWTLNGLIIFVGQPLISLMVRIFRTFQAQLYVGVVLYVSAFTLLFQANHYAVFVGGMILLTLGEMLVQPVIPAAAAQISPPSRRGFLQGFVGSAATVGRMIGPLVGGMIFDRAGFHSLMVAMVFVLCVPFVSFAVYARSRHIEVGEVPAA
ncbi:MAG: MDR family MFS transporter [Mycobacterium leprae]